MSLGASEPGAADGPAGRAAPPPASDPPPPTIADPRQAMLDLALGAARSLDPGFNAQVEPLARRLLAQLDPQGPAETMLVLQMIATFARSMFLARHANRQKDARWFALYSGECDRTTDLYRKQMRALDDHRNPRPPSFTAIRNANIAGQQVVVTGSPPPDALGPASPSHSKVAHARPAQPAPEIRAALPPDPRRKGRPPRRDPPEQAVGT